MKMIFMRHAINIFRAIEKLAQENSPYDAVLVNDWLPTKPT
jgi:replicative DNA helicase